MAATFGAFAGVLLACTSSAVASDPWQRRPIGTFESADTASAAARDWPALRDEFSSSPLVAASGRFLAAAPAPGLVPASPVAPPLPPEDGATAANATAETDNSTAPPNTTTTDEPSTAEVLQKLDITGGCLFAVLSVAGLALVCSLISFTFKSKKDTRLGRLRRADTMVLETRDIWGQNSEQCEKFVQEGLETEQFMTTGCWSLYLNRPWRKQQGPDVSVGELSDNADWLEHEVFPNGCVSQSVTLKTRAVWSFFFRKKRASTWPCIWMQVIEGVCPAVAAQLLSWIIQDLNASADSQKEDSGVQIGESKWFFFFIMSLAATHIIKDRAHYYYELEVPGASVRQELRQRLQAEFLQMPPHRAKAWPPGRCMAVLDRDVHTFVVNVWMGMFDCIRVLVQLATLIAATMWQTRKSLGMQLTLGIIYLIMLAGAVANIVVRRPNIIDLSKRKRDWSFIWMSVGSMQVHQARHGGVLLGTHAGAESTAVKQAATFFGNAAQVYRKRAFHYYFANMVSMVSSTEMVILAQTAVMTILGREAINGKISVGGVVGVLTAMNSMISAVGSAIQTVLHIVEGYASLTAIANIFNGGLGLVDSSESDPAGSEYTSSESDEEEVVLDEKSISAPNATHIASGSTARSGQAQAP